MLAGLTAAIAAPVLAGSLAACGDKTPDPLIALFNRAHTDADLLDAMAKVWPTPAAGQTDRPTGPVSADLLSKISQARRTHADKIWELVSDDPQPAREQSPASAQSTASGQALPRAIGALQSAYKESADLLAQLSRNEASVIGAVAACCDAYRRVLKDGAEPIRPADPPSDHTGRSLIPSDAADALQTALGTENAAVWCYGLAAAFLGQKPEEWARADADSHRAVRDDTSGLLTAGGQRPAAAEPAYRTPSPVNDERSAVELAVAAESDVAAAWHSVIARCDEADLRGTALAALTYAATRAARWNHQNGSASLVAALPGRA